MSFTQNFNYCMDQCGYSAYKFAQIIGVSNQGVLFWQSGKTVPHPKTRQKIADHFGITLAELDGDKLPTLPEKGAKKAPGQKAEGEMLDIETQRELVRQAISNTNDLGELLDMMDAINRKIRELK